MRIFQETELIDFRKYEKNLIDKIIFKAKLNNKTYNKYTSAPKITHFIDWLLPELNRI